MALRFSGYSAAAFGYIWSGRRTFNYTAVDASANSAVAACVLWIVRTFPEAPLTIYERDREGKKQPAPDHELTLLFERPNPYYSGVLLWTAILIDYLLNGNAYLRKIRSAGGRVVELWWVPSWMLAPAWPTDGSAFLTHYEYTVDGRTPEKWAIEDVVHFRFGLDVVTRKGISPIGSVLREVFTDDEAAVFTASLLRNMGIPGVLISPEGDEQYGGGRMDPDDAKMIKADYLEKVGGDNRGAPLVMTGKTKVQVLSFNPEQMDLKALRRIPEERISAVLGVPAIVAGLGAGLDRSTFANYAEAREAAYESNIIPTQRALAADIQAQLLPDFSDPKRFVAGFDISEVRVLQEDRDKLFTRANTGVTGGWLMVYDAKTMVGMAADDEDKYYLRSSSVTATLPGLPEPELEPQEQPPSIDPDALLEEINRNRNGALPTPV